MGNVEILKHGDIQFTMAGTVISHSEYNINKVLPIHFLQIWVKPDIQKLTPAYNTKSFPDSVKINNLSHIISPVFKQDPETIGIHTDFHMFASILQPKNKVVHKVQEAVNDGVNSRKLYVHLNSTGSQLKINENIMLKPGDGAFITDVVSGENVTFESIGDKDAEFVLFDLV